MNVLGIDPGKSGGLAIVSDIDRSTPRAWKMPDGERDLADLLNLVCAEIGKPTLAMMERVRSMPGQGVASTFAFGRYYGMVRMAVVGARIPLEEVSPQKWQKAMQCLSRGDKNVTKRRAQELFPALQVTHAIADALLIAEFGLRFLNGSLER